jgi:hypothetical protein
MLGEINVIIIAFHYNLVYLSVWLLIISSFLTISLLIFVLKLSEFMDSNYNNLTTSIKSVSLSN